MKDKNGKVIEEGMIIKGGRFNIEHKVIRGDFESSDYTQGDDLIADGGFVKTLITKENSGTFKII